MIDPSDIWNALPLEERRRLSGTTIQRQILDIKIEITRAKRAHAKHMQEARAHLKNCEDSLEKWKREMAALTGVAAE